jgi:uncharacterized sodium:solute symporter family permease YidK
MAFVILFTLNLIEILALSYCLDVCFMLLIVLSLRYTNTVFKLEDYDVSPRLNYFCIQNA